MTAARAVVRVDEDIADAELDRFHDAGVRAVRLDLFARAHQPTPGDHRLRPRMAATRLRGWHLQFYAPGTVVRDLLPFLADFEEPFVIDHMGYMKESEGLTSADGDRAARPAAAGRTAGSSSPAPYRLAGDGHCRRCTTWVAPWCSTQSDRLLWGSDWPHLPNGQRDTGELLDLLADWAPDPDDRHRILVESADRLFFDG